tara:strand:+ start:2171 stop:2491 length:321 start_codon:yes stop_codon:yes gene_type:complete
METKMNVKLVEVCMADAYSTIDQGGGLSKYILREIYLNPEHIVALRPDFSMKRRLDEGRFIGELDERQEFTKIYVNRGQSGFDVTVVGTPDVVQEKLSSTKKLLRG